jgi:hypothetical protein
VVLSTTSWPRIQRDLGRVIGAIDGAVDPGVLGSINPLTSSQSRNGLANVRNLFLVDIPGTVGEVDLQTVATCPYNGLACACRMPCIAPWKVASHCRIEQVALARCCQ